MSQGISPHIARITAERDELNTRLIALDAIIASEDFHTTVPNVMDRELMRAQSKVMHDYVDVLTERLSRVSSEY